MTIPAQAVLIRPTFAKSTGSAKAPTAILDKIERIAPIVALKTPTHGIPHTVRARIDDLTDKSAGPNGVWPWLGSRHQADGYPQISFKDALTGKTATRAVHRVLMELSIGRRLDRWEFVLHDRGVPKFDVNPAHHRIGTAQENTDDARAEGRLVGGGRRLKPAQVLMIDKLFHKDGVDVASLAHRFKVSNQTIKSIVVGKTHTKITGRMFVPGQPGRPKKRVLQVVTGGKGLPRHSDNVGAVC